MVHAAGARVPKFRQELSDTHGFNALEQAGMTELLLRGPQTAAELRARVPRMVPTVAEVADLRGELGDLRRAFEAFREAFQ